MNFRSCILTELIRTFEKKIEKMKKLLVAFIITIVAFVGTLSAQEGTTEYYGAKITEKGAVSATQFLQDMEGKETMEVKLEAKIETCCKKKGCWMDLDMENGTTMKVRFKDYEFFVPKDADGRMAIVEGVAKVETVDVETLRHYAEDAGKSEDEIAAITESESAISFEAVGVIIK